MIYKYIYTVPRDPECYNIDRYLYVVRVNAVLTYEIPDHLP